MDTPQDTLAEQIAAQLRRAILFGTLPPDAPITRARSCEVVSSSDLSVVKPISYPRIFVHIGLTT